MGNRRKSREAAIQILYSLEISGCDPQHTMQAYWEHFKPAENLRDFSSLLVKGVCQHKKEIDRIIASIIKNWSMNRITPVDLSILREAIFELLYCPDIPVNVTLNEAIELGKKFGTEKSASFINGILDKIPHHFPLQKKPCA